MAWKRCELRKRIYFSVSNAAFASRSRTDLSAVNGQKFVGDKEDSILHPILAGRNPPQSNHL